LTEAVTVRIATAPEVYADDGDEHRQYENSRNCCGPCGIVEKQGDRNRKFADW